MKHSEVRRLAEIFNDWLRFEDKQAAIRDICRAGPTQESKMLEYHGVFPQLSNIKPEILIAKAEKVRMFEASKEERKAAMLVNAFPLRSGALKIRAILTEHHKRRNRNNAATNNNWTHNDVAYVLDMEPDSYNAIREFLSGVLLKADSMQSPALAAQIIAEMFKEADRQIKLGKCA